MHTFKFDSTRYKEVRNKAILNSAVFMVLLYTVIFRDDILSLFTDFDYSNGFLIVIAVVLGIAFIFINNSDTKEHYESISIIIDEQSITHYEKGSVKGTLLFTDIKEIIKYPSGLEIKTKYLASSLTVLPQMQNYSQIIELLAKVKPIQVRLISSSYLITLLSIIALGIMYAFISRDLVRMILYSTATACLCYVTFTFFASPLVSSDDKWARGPIFILMILAFSYLTFNSVINLFHLY
ncbi:MAG: hypothetical protein M0D57_14120 [Sphingobacteriales bacterium JAD_PAG50586_3]|nr:MAG: hypothetical protein M0D57_14120 [Sphingobacteriales bacterium JAD_PAG50586_3]